MNDKDTAQPSINKISVVFALDKTTKTMVRYQPKDTDSRFVGMVYLKQTDELAVEGKDLLVTVQLVE